MVNPLLALSFNELPAFSLVRPEHVEIAIDELLNNNRHAVKTLLNNNKIYTWENLMWPLELMEGRLQDVWSVISHLNRVMNSSVFYKAYQRSLPKLTLYHTEIYQNENLYQAILSIQQAADYEKLDVAQKKVIKNWLRDFKRAGIALPPDKKVQFKQWNVKLSDLESQFEQNVLESTDAWSFLVTDRNQLKDLPTSTLDIAAKEASHHGKNGWLLTVDYPCYHAVMTYAEDRKLRELLYKAYATRAAEKDPWNNSPLMVEILQIRQTLAALLGFNHYSEYALDIRMLKKPEEVLDFLSILIEHAKKIALKEAAELIDFAKTEYDHASLEVWDVAYFSEKLLQKKHAISEEILRAYFVEENVLQGLFTVAARLYDLHIREIKDFDSWHPTVRLFEVYDADGTLRGKFYIDLHARANKQSGAWVENARVRMRRPDGNLQIPVVYLVANFSKPADGMPYLLTHDEVITLFHEFGHCLHHILVKMDYPSIATGNGVMWDAIELPSQLMENWCWEKEALQLFARHFNTQANLSEELFLKLTQMKYFHIGLELVKQLEFALFDFTLHMNTKIKNEEDIQAILDKVRERTLIFPVPKFNRYQNSFKHIFSGEYAAGYYSYLWSEVLSADVYKRFKEKQAVFDKDIAKHFLSTILEPGGLKDFMELFMDFMGRKPKVDAFLSQFKLV